MAKSLWQERNLATMLLVRSVEEHEPDFFTPEVLSAAALAASNARDDRELIEKRSAYLFLRLPASLKAWAHIGLLPESSLSAVVVAAFLAGGLSNFLGPSGLVHVVYNPLAFLVAWNVAAYALFAWRALHAPRAGVIGLLARDVGSLWSRWAHRVPSDRLRHADRIAATFRERYWAAAGPVVLARIETLMHVAAISLLLGGIGGTYVRGLFLEYNAIWRSTFLTDPGAVSTLLNVLFAPGIALFDHAHLATAQVEPLLAAGGAPAAPWIHRIALTAAVVVLLPRAALAFVALRRALRHATRLEVDLQGDEYYLAQLRAARDDHMHRLREDIHTIVRSGVAKLAETVALFVQERFFDIRVAPTLLQFRNRGGRIRELEAEIAAAREAFQPQLLAHLQDAQQELETSVRGSLERLVGHELALASAVSPGLSHPSVPLGQTVSGSVAESVGDGLGATVVMGITAVIASLSGGIGKSLGIAVVSGLLGTSGPIGLLIGGIAGLALAGTGYLVGRERITAAVKNRALPATLVAFALTDAKLEQARQATYATVKEQLVKDLQPQVTFATAAVLQRLAAAADAGAAPAARI